MKCPNKGCNSTTFIENLKRESGEYIIRTYVCCECRADFNTFEMIIPPNSVIKVIPEGEAPLPTTGLKRLTFDRLRKANLLRDQEIYNDMPHWTTSDWGLAFAGEAGEACNKIKKLKKFRDKQLQVAAKDPVNFEMKSKKLRHEIGEELADTVIYADFLAQNLCLDLSEAIIAKFNLKSHEENSTVFL